MAAVEGGTKGGSGYFQAPRVSTRQRGEEGEGRIRLKDGRTGSGEAIWGGRESARTERRTGGGAMRRPSSIH
ncbi:MAG: hypothetical protein DMF49_02000 [Acidobacteria bacterium]|nr:MAG: hypothetical protein DMF49_02000 [Acidobacteriota bacterium]